MSTSSSRCLASLVPAAARAWLDSLSRSSFICLELAKVKLSTTLNVVAATDACNSTSLAKSNCPAWRNEATAAAALSAPLPVVLIEERALSASTFACAVIGPFK